MSGEREIVRIQVDLVCDKNCEACEKFFDCRDPYKYQVYERRRMDIVRERMSKVRHKVMVIAGKGGTGKSTLTVNLSAGMAMKGYKVGILDQDFDGPCIPKMFGLSGGLYLGDTGIIPRVYEPLGIKIVSTGMVIDADEPLTWYHELRRGATEEFLAHVDWQELDYLFIDLPPGTSSDNVNILQHLPDLSGAILVTVPSLVSQGVARRAGVLALKADVEILGVVENMSGFACPHCGEVSYILREGGGRKLAEELEAPFLGAVPLDPRMSECCDEGVPFIYKYPDSPVSKLLLGMCEEINKALEAKGR